LYADFGADGIYKYESGVWSQITTSNPAIMAAGY
jgi:hypothetical protein